MNITLTLGETCMLLIAIALVIYAWRSAKKSRSMEDLTKAAKE